MKVTQHRREGFAEIWEFAEPAAQFHAFIALHDLSLGPALGGVRIRPYPDSAVALEEVLRLARQMTFKAAVARLPFGGGKAVVLLPTGSYDRAALMTRFGKAIESLRGRYITAKDVGSSETDMALIAQETSYVTGLPQALGGKGDPSPLTAYGVFLGIGAGRKFLGDDRTWNEYRVGIQGLGGVGGHLAKELIRAGARVWATDTHPEKFQTACQSEELHPCGPEEIYDLPVDCFSPCALGQILNSQTIPRLQVHLVAGGANDQLADEKVHAGALKERRILYAPDFVINCGGLIHVAYERLGKVGEQARVKVQEVASTLQEIFSDSHKTQCSTHESALRVAKSRLESKGR